MCRGVQPDTWLSLVNLLGPFARNALSIHHQDARFLDAANVPRKCAALWTAPFQTSWAWNCATDRAEWAARRAHIGRRTPYKETLASPKKCRLLLRSIYNVSRWVSTAPPLRSAALVWRYKLIVTFLVLQQVQLKSTCDFLRARQLLFSHHVSKRCDDN